MYHLIHPGFLLKPCWLNAALQGIRFISGGGYQAVNPDLFFAIAHELRHVWQIKNAESFSLSTYQPIDLLHSVEEYNLQTAEIDANAFAAVIMVDYFGVKPLFNNLSETVKEQIFERMEMIKNGL